MQAEYDVGREEIERDLRALIAQLREKKLLGTA
jgi:hypothetical protein